jgi:two-component system KDP operon response regulator KdpE
MEEETGTLVRSDLTIDFERHRVIRGEEEIRLTPKEFELLACLARYQGKVLTHRTILKAIWGPHAVSEPQYLRVLMASLRKKIEPDPAHPKYVLTEPWVGYRFREE